MFLHELLNLRGEARRSNLRLPLTDFKDGNLAARGWLPPPVASAYAASKALVNAYSRLLARRQPSLVVCCVNPGFVRTGMSYGMGLVSAEAGAKPPVVLALRDEPGDSGLNFELFDVCEFREGCGVLACWAVTVCCF
nr:salutaridine reductase-like [Setaria viridis]